MIRLSTDTHTQSQICMQNDLNTILHTYTIRDTATNTGPLHFQHLLDRKQNYKQSAEKLTLQTFKCHNFVTKLHDSTTIIQICK